MRAALTIACVLAIATSAVALKKYEFAAPGYTFEQYVTEFNKSYDGAEYVRHFRTFQANLQLIIRHNSDSSQTYKLAVNKFTDLDVDERKRFFGFSLGKKLSSALNAQPMEMPAMSEEDLPASVDWRNHNPPVITPVKDQGGCGSCWAHATTELVEFAVATATGTLKPLSRQNIVDCTPNPNDCGGTGGCEGATAELGFAYVVSKGMASEEAYPYTASDGTCDESIAKSASITGWTVLPSNNYTAVKQGVATLAPLAITVAANSWFDYSSGVFTGCDGDWDLNHAVQLVGYGKDSGQDYFNIRNSWSSDWGEDGYIRIAQATDGSPCGTDTTPSDGTGCTGGPPTQHVCGSCGVLFDTTFSFGGSIPPTGNVEVKPAHRRHHRRH